MATVTGTEDADYLAGTAGHDEFDALGGNDVILAGAGNDHILAGDGDDWVEGGDGNDFHSGGNGIDTLSYESAGHAVTVNIRSRMTSYQPTGGGFYDLVVDFENVVGSAFDDTLIGDPFRDNRIYGGGGNDSLFGDHVDEGFGQDFLDGGTGADFMAGGRGGDIYVVDNPLDVVVERYGVEGGIDALYAKVSYALAADTEMEFMATTAEARTDTIDLHGNDFVQSIYGNAGANRLAGGGGNDYLVGLEGDDLLDGGSGSDNLRGGAGNDRYVIDDASDALFEEGGEGADEAFTGVSFRLTAGAHVEMLATTDAAGNAALNLTGNDLGNSLYGNAGANVLGGDGGGDYLVGLGGDDILIGGGGADVLRGGAGADEYRFDTHLGGGNVDRIADFASGGDWISLDHAIFTGLAPGALAAGAFHVGTTAADAEDRILYDSASGTLYFDADGTGAAAAILFAFVQPGVTLSAADFTVI